MSGRVLHLSLAAGRQFDFFYNIWSCVRPLFGCRSSVRFFLTCLVVSSTSVWLFLSFGLLFSCLVVYCSTLFLTLLIIWLIVFYCLLVFSRARPFASILTNKCEPLNAKEEEQKRTHAPQLCTCLLANAHSHAVYKEHFGYHGFSFFWLVFPFHFISLSTCLTVSRRVI